MPSQLQGMATFGFYADALKLKGELAERLGLAPEARDAYQEFVRLRADADPPLQPEVADARARLARLGQP